MKHIQTFPIRGCSNTLLHPCGEGGGLAWLKILYKKNMYKTQGKIHKSLKNSDNVFEQPLKPASYEEEDPLSTSSS